MTDYKYRTPIDFGQRISFADHDFEIIPDGNGFAIAAPGDVTHYAPTLEEAFVVLQELTEKPV